jgi:alanine dehydrogenase
VPLYLTEADVAGLVGPADALAAIEASFLRQARGEALNRPRQREPIGDGTLAVMWAVDNGLGLAGVKSYAWLPGGTPFTVVLYSIERAALEAVIEADKLGQLRTGAASGVAAKYLARPGARTLGVIGCGWQAESQVEAIRTAVPGIEEVVAYCRNAERLADFCARLGCSPGESHRDAGEQDIVVTATTSSDPVLRGEWLKPGALVCAVGANDAAKRELDNAVLERATFICCDSLEEAQVESGDLIDPVAQGIVDWREVRELHQVVAGELPGRTDDDDIVLFKSNGIAIWDVAIGAVAVALARERGVGREL